MKVQTKAVHFSADKKLIQFIEKKLSKLEQRFNRITGVEVVLKLENTGKIKDKIAEIYLKVPGGIIIAKETHKKFEGAVDASVMVLKRQLSRHKERARLRNA